MKYFGTDGFRGEANIALTASHAYRIGRYLGNFYKGSKIVIGKDTRRSSYMLEQALAAGIVSSGADAYLLHVTTTPSVSYAVLADSFSCGIMISASHNPFYDNGIKLISHDGSKMDEKLLEKIEEYIDCKEDDLPLATREEIGQVKDHSFGRNRYIGYLISTARRSCKGKRIGLDCANGASFMIAKNVFDALGAETYVIHDRPNGININVDSGSTHMDDLVELVKDQKLDCAFAFDGDADRCLAVDNNGEIVDGDRILYICGMALKDEGALLENTVVTTVMSNFGLHKAFEEKGINTVQTKVGDKYVSACMQEKGYVLGGEQSGHIIFSKYATTGDGVLTAIRLMEILVEYKTDMASLHRDMITYPQILKNIRVKDKKTVLQNEKVLAVIDEVGKDLKGLGRTLVRPSGTEPLLRVMAEHMDAKICEEAVDRIIQAIYDENLVLEV